MGSNTRAAGDERTEERSSIDQSAGRQRVEQLLRSLQAEYRDTTEATLCDTDYGKLCRWQKRAIRNDERPT